MKFEIDQSGKVEDTAKLTIVAYANGKAKTLKISAVEKRRLIGAMKQLAVGKIFIYQIFAGLVFLLIKGEKVNEVVIDREYPGHEASIKQILLQLFQKSNLESPTVHFTLIGRQSQVHKIAIETFRGKRKPDLIVKAEDVLVLFLKK